MKKLPLSFGSNNSESDIHITIGRCTAFFFLAGIFLSWPLWVGQRIFPFIPLIQLDELTCSNLGKIVNWLLLVFLTTILAKPTKYTVVGAVICVVCSAMLDQMRIQPWFFCYLLVLCGFLFRKSGNEQRGIYMAIIFSVYFFGGLWKLNQHYFQVVNFTGEKAILLSVIKVSFYTIPVFEILFSFTLFAQRIRKSSIVASAIFHALIIIFLLVRGENWVVIPWNIFLPVLTYQVLWNEAGFSPTAAIKNLFRHAVCLILAVYICFSPFLYSMKYLDRYLSWGLYTEDNADLWITIFPDQYSSFKDELKYELEVQNLTGARILSLNYFALKDVHVPLVSEPRVFRYLTDYYCKKTHYSNTLVFSEYERPFEAGKYKSWACQSITYDRK